MMDRYNESYSVVVQNDARVITLAPHVDLTHIEYSNVDSQSYKMTFKSLIRIVCNVIKAHLPTELFSRAVTV